jgi:Transposase DDE domain
MSRPLQLTSWQQELATRFPALSASAVGVLALYSFGMILSQVVGQSAVALFLACHLNCAYHAVRKRLREFYLPAAAKSGIKQGCKRKDFDVTTCFAPLLRWILSLWSGRHLALAIDVTNLGERFHVLCVSVVVDGVAIPVAWKVLWGGVKEPWGPQWEKLLNNLKDAVPQGWTVLVLSDRGLESPDLFRFIVDLDWHPLMRVKKGGKFRPKGWGNFYYFHQMVQQVGGSFAAEGVAYTGEQLRCTLLACWTAGHEEPWLLLTNLPPEAGNAIWYGLRTWIEQGFKIIKSGGWDWQKTRMEDPDRVERLWLVLAVATLWVVAVGAQDEAQERIRAALQHLAREMNASAEQAQRRQEAERLRREQQQAALAARQARKQKRQEAKQQAAAQKAEAKKAKAAAKAAAAKPLEAALASGKAVAAAMPVAAATREAGKPVAAAQPTRPSAAAVQRIHRVSRRGLAVLKAAWERGQCPLPQHLCPEPWPPPAHSASTLTEQDFLAQQT